MVLFLLNIFTENVSMVAVTEPKEFLGDPYHPSIHNVLSLCGLGVNTWIKTSSKN